MLKFLKISNRYIKTIGAFINVRGKTLTLLGQRFQLKFTGPLLLSSNLVPELILALLIAFGSHSLLAFYFRGKGFESQSVIHAGPLDY